MCGGLKRIVRSGTETSGKEKPPATDLYNLYVHDNQSPVTIHKFIYYRNTDNTGTQCVLLNFFVIFFIFIFFLNLTCMLKKSQSWGLSSGLDQSRPFSRSHQLPAYIPDKVFKPTQTAEASRYDAFAFTAQATLADLRPDTEGLTGSRIWLIILISMGEKNRGMYLVSTSDKSLTGRFCYRRQTPRGPFQATSLLLTEKKSKSFSFVYVDTQCRFTEGPKSYSDHGRAEPKLLLAFIVTGGGKRIRGTRRTHGFL